MYLIFAILQYVLLCVRTFVWILMKKELHLLNHYTELILVWNSESERMVSSIYIFSLSSKSLKGLQHDTAFLSSFRYKSISTGAPSGLRRCSSDAVSRFLEVHVPLLMILFISFWNAKLNYYSTRSNYNMSKKRNNNIVYRLFGRTEINIKLDGIFRQIKPFNILF